MYKYKKNMYFEAAKAGELQENNVELKVLTLVEGMYSSMGDLARLLLDGRRCAFTIGWVALRG